MRYILLADDTRLDGFTDATTSDYLVHQGATYAEAAAVMDEITPENTVAIRVYEPVLGGEDKLITSGGDLVLNLGATLAAEDDHYICTFTLRHKTETEIMKDEISELQDIVMDM